MKQFKYRGHQYRVAAKLQMFHGTSTGKNNERIRRILKQGLIPDPKQEDKPYGGLGEGDDDYGMDSSTRDIIQMDESFGGTYVTDSLQVAKDYAHNTSVHTGGDRLLLALQIETRTPGTAIDEDLLFQPAMLLVERLAPDDPTDAYIWATDEADWNKIAELHLKDQFPKIKLHSARLTEATPRLGCALEAWYIADLIHEEGDLIEEGMFDRYDDDSPLYADDYISDYQECAQDVTLMLKELTAPEASRGRHNIRLTEPIGFSGANQILAAVSWRDAPSYSSDNPVGTVWYSKDKEAANQLVSAAGRNRDWYWPDGTKIVPSGQKAAHRASVNTKPTRELNARQSTTKCPGLSGAPTGRPGGRVHAERPAAQRNQGSHRKPDRDYRAAVGNPTVFTPRTKGDQLMTHLPHIRLALDSQPETNDPTVGPQHDGPSESKLVDQLEKDPGANWEEVYLQPIIRAIRNRFDLEKGQVVLVGPKKKVPFGTDTLGFDITGHVRFDDFVPPEDQAGTAPYRFTAHVDPQGELMLPVEVRGGAMDNEDGDV